MLAAVYHGPNDIRVETVSTPEIGPEEILLKVLNASICGTDIRIFHGHHRKYPPGTHRIPGHEMVVDPINEDLKEIVLAESYGRGADVIITAAPAHKVQESALALAAIGGRINFFGGLPKDDPIVLLDSNLIHYKELVITGTTACSTHDCLRAAELINSNRLDLSPLISQRYPLQEAPAAFAAAEDRKTLKVVLEP